MPSLAVCRCLFRLMRHCFVGRWICLSVSERLRLVWRCRLFDANGLIPGFSEVLAAINNSVFWIVLIPFGISFLQVTFPGICGLFQVFTLCLRSWMIYCGYSRRSWYRCDWEQSCWPSWTMVQKKKKKKILTCQSPLSCFYGLICWTNLI